MANCFLTSGHEEVETAILLEKAVQVDLSIIDRDYANAVAFTDGRKVFVNSDDNLAKILPAYNQGMLKWLLWHEEYHKQLKHHNRFFRYLDELRADETFDQFRVTKSEVNIIMDILVHDSLSKMFPELVETATTNLAQMRNRNSLGYTFKTYNLEDMLDEYAKFKHKDEDDKDGAGEPTDSDEPEDEETAEDSDGMGTPKKSKDKKKDDSKDKSKDKSDDKKDSTGEKGHEEGGGRGDSPSGEDEKSPEVADGSPKEEPKEEPTLPDEHDKTDWSKLEDISDEEFIDEDESDHIMDRINELKRKKFRLAKLTETLNGMVTTTKIRTYARPSYVGVDRSIMLKGRKYGKTALYLVFDASGSMGSELALFKEIISKAIPQAMKVPCEWFSGCGERIAPNPAGKSYDYYKGTFKDIMPVHASSGYNDDGDRVLLLCEQAERKGFTPIGVTDGGGGIDRPDILKKLTRTVLVGSNKAWLEKAKQINPRVQILDV